MDQFSYAFVTEQDLERCERLRARGAMLPGMDFVLKPRFADDGSVEFRLRMIVPALLWVGFGVATAVGGAEAVHQGMIAIGSTGFWWVFGLLLFFLLLAILTVRMWRSARIWPDGRAQLSLPRLGVLRRTIEGMPGETRLLAALSYGRGEKVKRFAPQPPSSMFLNPGRAKYRSEPSLVLAVGGFNVMLGRGDADRLRSIAQLLQEDYGLELEHDPVLYRYQGLV